MRFLAIAAMLIAIAGCSKPAQPPSTNNHAEAEAGPHKGLDRSHKGDATPGVVFKNPDGGDISIAKFKGVPVVVNLWATWCAPCVKELPTLDKLAQSHDLDGALAVIAVNQEDKPHTAVEAFLKETVRVKSLGAYQDPSMALMGKLGPDAVLPTTFLYDANGKEVWRYVGDLDWTSPEAARLLSEAGAPAHAARG
jgi:thiol-disulfide isomerase/thioredoxin